jgi:hypothetical protein
LPSVIALDLERGTSIMPSARLYALFCCAAIFLVQCVLANEEEPASVFVKDADPSTFDDLVINSKKFSLVGFFAPVRLFLSNVSY